MVEHRPGKSHANADGLSRRPSTEGTPDNTKDVANVDNGKCVMAVSKQKIEESSSWIPRMSEDQIRQAQQNDQVLVPLIESVRAGERPVSADIQGSSRANHVLWSNWQRFTV